MEPFKVRCMTTYMKVACSDLLLLYLIGRLPIASPPNLWQVTLWHDTLPSQTQRCACGWQRRRQAEKWMNMQAAVIENSESLRSLQTPELKAEAVSQIDYACTPLKTQAAKVPEPCWIIYRLMLVFTERWAEFKGMRWRIKVWALWKHCHSQHEPQLYKGLHLCWVQAEASRYYHSRSQQVPSWHRGREFREGAQPEHANVQSLQVSEHMPTWLLRKYGRAMCQTSHDPSSPTTLPHNCLDPSQLAIHQISWATSAIEINTKQEITEDLHMPFSVMVSPGFEARTSGKKLIILSHPKCKI